MMAEAVDPEKILRDLRDLWAQLGREQESASGVLRACAMTLIVIAEDQGECNRVRQTVGVLMHNHPSRAIVLRASEGAELSARVFAECWMPFGRQQQICSEGIEMTADAADLGEVARLLVPLIAPDLPVVLWCRGGRFFSSRYFDPLFRLAAKIIVDSAAAVNPRGAIAVLKEIRGRGPRIADLAWTRLTPWREAMADLLDDHPVPVASARIQYAGAISTEVLYFARWIETASPATRIAMEVVEGQAGIQNVILSGNGGELTATLAGGSIELRAGGRTSRSMIPAGGEDVLMREELSIIGPDAVFESVLC